MADEVLRDINLKQRFSAYDLLGPLVVWAIFFGFVLIFSVTFLNWFCVREDDDITVMEEWAYNHNLGLRLGPHRHSVVARNVNKHRGEIEIEEENAAS
ncbi:unnamed protein product, partial [Mesorhabditis belari]|uniref:Uncharacterized protein n=1 Tax=Mesorhabditis belari TaxID=2138241 RepID=A0AAF3ESK5_9BILA